MYPMGYHCIQWDTIVSNGKYLKFETEQNKIGAGTNSTFATRQIASLYKHLSYELQGLHKEENDVKNVDLPY